MLARYGFASTLIAAAQIDCVKMPLTGAAVASEKTGTAMEEPATNDVEMYSPTIRPLPAPKAVSANQARGIGVGFSVRGCDQCAPPFFEETKPTFSYQGCHVSLNAFRATRIWFFPSGLTAHRLKRL